MVGFWGRDGACAGVGEPAGRGGLAWLRQQGGRVLLLCAGRCESRKSAYTSKIAGARPATIYRSVDDNIEYRVTVVDFAGRAKDEAAIIKEAATVFGANKKVLADAEARVEMSYGRKMTIDLPNNGEKSDSGRCRATPTGSRRSARRHSPRS